MSSNIMSSGSGTNHGDITADSASSTDTAALNPCTNNASKIYEFNKPVFNGPTTFGTPLYFVFRWDIACG